ncbi:3-hydroxyisobutyrate dehydrogenase [Coniophora puteana RWD-64-598 SS2]|uniref:3-hydroxyisobutyrate dehydrogenase n=1 Tax=Coniophora puteana (strain RWD-64-598) TaxID=741705 RepID=A0A5M3N1W9_CONPW|nr:3-hydroxyisobutyrate dehydrogenase [Coniophora puteana RWD-64-598 SS2]EIW85379.1 3-hydroxyisobutyrate dehydrogenase [Coniophora puteana RWD-64-598 SS2]
MRPTVRLLQSISPAATTRQNAVAFIGLGRMGANMAYNLFSKTYASNPATKFVLCDAVPSVALDLKRRLETEFNGLDVQVVLKPEEAVKAAQTVLTMLPSSPHVKTVYTEDGGILPTLHALASHHTLLIDSTTLDVDVARAVMRDAENAGAKMVDAPVSGGVAGAKAGTLSFLVGGPDATYKLAHPYLSMMGARIIHCGPAGAGLGAKICNNLVLGVQQIVVGEAMLLGERLGLDAGVLAGVINSSTGACWSCHTNNPVPGALKEKAIEPPCERDYEGGFATALMLKDMNLATQGAQKHGTALPMGTAAKEYYDRIIQANPVLARKDFSSVYTALREDKPSASREAGSSGLS